MADQVNWTDKKQIWVKANLIQQANINGLFSRKITGNGMVSFADHTSLHNNIKSDIH